MAETETVNGITWTYTVSDGKATVGGGSDSTPAVSTATTGAITIPFSLGGYPVTSIGNYAFYNCRGLTTVAIPDSVISIGNNAFYYCRGLMSVRMPGGVKSIGERAFCYCSGLTSVMIGDGVTSIGERAFVRCSGLTSVTIPGSVTNIGIYAFHDCGICFEGMPPVGVDAISSLCACIYPLCYATQWENALGSVTGQRNLAVGMSSKIRDNDSTILDVEFMAFKAGPRERHEPVKVRALAFEDGTRSFAKVVRPETFVNDLDGNPTAQNIGDAIEANIPHKLSWKVSSDWATRLAKVKFEVLACDGEPLRLELRTIPASDQYGKMKVSWNVITKSQTFDALLWLYADKDTGLTLAGGTLKNGSVLLASGTDLAGSNSYYDENGSYVGSHLVPNANAARYVFGKMGYSLLEGGYLNYANQETRLGLKPYGVRQYAYKIVEE